MRVYEKRLALIAKHLSHFTMKKHQSKGENRNPHIAIYLKIFETYYNLVRREEICVIILKLIAAFPENFL